MPRSYKKKSIAKRYHTRYAKRKSQYSRNSITKQPFAQHRNVQMGYSSNITMTSTLGTPAGNVWRANNIYDPDYNNVGTDHQAFGYDQLAAVYNNWNVYACKIELQVIGTSPVVLTCRAQPTATTPANLELDAERGNSLVCMLNANGSPKKCVMFRRTTDVLGKPRSSQFVENDMNGTSSGTSPVNKWYYTLCIQHPDRVSTVSAYVNVKLTYYVRWLNRKLISQS